MAKTSTFCRRKPFFGRKTSVLPRKRLFDGQRRLFQRARRLFSLETPSSERARLHFSGKKARPPRKQRSPGQKMPSRRGKSVSRPKKPTSEPWEHLFPCKKASSGSGKGFWKDVCLRHLHLGAIQSLGWGVICRLPASKLRGFNSSQGPMINKRSTPENRGVRPCFMGSFAIDCPNDRRLHP